MDVKLENHNINDEDRCGVKHWVLLVCPKSSKFVEITKSEMELLAFYTQPDPASLYYKELTPAQTIFFWLKARGIMCVYEDQEDTLNKFGKTDLQNDIAELHLI